MHPRTRALVVTVATVAPTARARSRSSPPLVSRATEIDAPAFAAAFEAFLDEYVDPLAYDIVLIDLPGMTNNVSYNGLWAAQNVIVPIEMGPFEAEQADALRRDLNKIAANFATTIELALVLPNKVDTRTTLAEEYLDAFEREYPDAIAADYVPYSQDIRNAAQHGQTAFALTDPSTTARQAREAYLAAADLLAKRLKGEIHV